MDVLILTPVSMLGELLEQCLAAQNDIKVAGLVTDFEQLRSALEGLALARPDTDAQRSGVLSGSLGSSLLILIDVTQGVDLNEVRQLAIDFPGVLLVALGLKSQRPDVVRAGRAGFCTFVARDAGVATLIKTMRDAVAGRLSCSEEIAGGLLRALFRGAANADSLADASPAPLDDTSLTRRESDVARLVSRGLSNKEIARELTLSVATVKHHVHSVLGKWSLQSRSHIMRRVREAPWIAAFPGPDRRRVPR